jgi:hypothetical protein
MHLTPKQRSSVVLNYVYQVETHATTIWNCVDSPSLDGSIHQIHYFCNEFDEYYQTHAPPSFSWQGSKFQYDLRSYNLGKNYKNL